MNLIHDLVNSLRMFNEWAQSEAMQLISQGTLNIHYQINALKKSTIYFWIPEIRARLKGFFGV